MPGTDELTKAERREGKITASVQDVFRNLEHGRGYTCTIDHTNQLPSYSGTLFSVKHTLTVRAVTPSYTTNPVLMAPVLIYAHDERSRQFPDVEVEGLVTDKSLYGMRENMATGAVAPIAVSEPVAARVGEEVGHDGYGKDFTVVQAYYGGNAQEEEDHAIIPATPLGGCAMTLSTLVQEMESSIYDMIIVERYVKAAHSDGEANWMCTLTADDLNFILPKVHDLP